MTKLKTKLKTRSTNSLKWLKYEGQLNSSLTKRGWAKSREIWFVRLTKTREFRKKILSYLWGNIKQWSVSKMLIYLMNQTLIAWSRISNRVGSKSRFVTQIGELNYNFLVMCVYALLLNNNKMVEPLSVSPSASDEHNSSFTSDTASQTSQTKSSDGKSPSKKTSIH